MGLSRFRSVGSFELVDELERLLGGRIVHLEEEHVFGEELVVLQRLGLLVDIRRDLELTVLVIPESPVEGRHADDDGCVQLAVEGHDLEGVELEVPHRRSCLRLAPAALLQPEVGGELLVGVAEPLGLVAVRPAGAVGLVPAVDRLPVFRADAAMLSDDAGPALGADLVVVAVVAVDRADVHVSTARVVRRLDAAVGAAVGFVPLLVAVGGVLSGDDVLVVPGFAGAGVAAHGGAGHQSHEEGEDERTRELVHGVLLWTRVVIEPRF